MGSPQEVIEKTLTFREYFGDYQRQLFLIDHAGLPLKTVLEQLDLFGEEVLPVLRKEYADQKPAHVPDAPTHANRVAAPWQPRTPAKCRGGRIMASGKAGRPRSASPRKPGSHCSGPRWR